MYWKGVYIASLNLVFSTHFFEILSGDMTVLIFKPDVSNSVRIDKRNLRF